MAFGSYPSFAAALSIAFLLSAEMLDPGRKQRATADWDTPASCATSYDVGRWPGPDCGVGLGFFMRRSC